MKSWALKKIKSNLRQLKTGETIVGWKRKQQDNNFVAKHAHKFNKSATFADRKKRQKKGHVKHKGQEFKA
jgi:hypothetical protein